ncbi:Acylneuraminate cytidylyltransferase, partial [Candidatus Magnetomorum sp. HK-1]
MKQKVLGLITARAGSKGIINKNKRNLAGKPLIAWTIEAAQESNVFSDIIISTDDKDVIQIAKNHNVRVPFIRPKELALDDSSHIDVIIHALDWLKKHDNKN